MSSRLIEMFKADKTQYYDANTTMGTIEEWAADRIEELQDTVARLHAEKRCRACIGTNPDEDCQSCGWREKP